MSYVEYSNYIIDLVFRIYHLDFSTLRKMLTNGEKMAMVPNGMKSGGNIIMHLDVRKNQLRNGVKLTRQLH